MCIYMIYIHYILYILYILVDKSCPINNSIKFIELKGYFSIVIVISQHINSYSCILENLSM